MFFFFSDFCLTLRCQASLLPLLFSLFFASLRSILAYLFSTDLSEKQSCYMRILSTEAPTNGAPDRLFIRSTVAVVVLSIAVS